MLARDEEGECALQPGANEGAERRWVNIYVANYGPSSSLLPRLFVDFAPLGNVTVVDLEIDWKPINCYNLSKMQSKQNPLL